MPELMKVLLISESETVRFLHQRLLRRYGVTQQVEVAASTHEALALLATTSPDLVLLDTWQPRESVAFARAYQQLPAAQQRPPLVLLTVTLGFSSAELEQLQQLPIAGVIDKPLTEQKAQQLVQLAAHSHRAGPVAR